MYHKAVETIGQCMKKLVGEKSMAEREIERFQEDLRSGDVRKLQGYKTSEMWQHTFAMSSRRAKQAGVEPTIEEKMQLESLRQNPTYEKIIEGDIINPYPAYCNYCAFAMFAQNWHKKFQLRFKTVANLGKLNTKYMTIVR